MNIISSAVLIGMTQLSKIILGILLIKIIALYLGPEGLGRLGNLISLVTFIMIVSGGGIENSVVKYVSQYRTSPVSLLRFINLSVNYSFIFSLFFLVVFCLFSWKISFFIFGDSDLYWIIIFLGFLQFLIAFNKLVISVANGYKNTKVLAISQISGNFLSIPIIWFLVYYYGFIGGAFAFLISSVVAFIPSFYFYKKNMLYNYINIDIISSSFKKYNKLYGFSLMALVSALVFPIVEVYVRQMIVGFSGYEQAGIWQAVMKLSSVYLSFFALFLAYYIVPIVSPVNDFEAIKKIVFKYMAGIGFLFILGSVVFCFFGDFFVILLLSEEFLALSDVIYLQFIGDFFKVLAFVIGFVFVAKAHVKIYIFMEIFQAVLLIFFYTFFYEKNHQLESLLEGYIVANLVFFFVTLLLFFSVKLNDSKVGV
jgi:PST family polysaccharide transporter/antigen flippase